MKSLDVSLTKEKRKFKLTANLKVDEPDYSIENSGVCIWARVDTKQATRGFFDNMADRVVKSTQWNNYIIEGFIDENSADLHFGGICINKQTCYFEDFRLYIEDELGNYQEIDLVNSELILQENTTEIDGWRQSHFHNDLSHNDQVQVYSTTDELSEKSVLVIKIPQ